MEAPTPNKFPKKIIDFKCDEKKYGLTLSCETNLKICINCLEKNQFFEKEFSYDEITKINRYFLFSNQFKIFLRNSQVLSMLNQKLSLEIIHLY